jgi:V/A-type H+-transporting ATPase subunit E
MTGADKIIATIEEESLAKRQAILSAAAEQAAQLVAQARQQAAQDSQAALEQAKKTAAHALEAAQAAAVLTLRRQLLQTKNEVIAQAIAAALQQLSTLPKAKYFEVLLQLAASQAQPGEGELRLSPGDLQRLPAGFRKKLNQALKDTGAKLQVSAETTNTQGGFVLVYGDIEQNCTFEALVAAKMDDIKDALYACLFAQEGGA